MKIAHIVSTFPPYKGGIGNICYNQVKNLLDLGHSVTVFLPQYENITKEFISHPNLTIVRIKPVLKYGNAAFLPQLLFKIKKFDIIHYHYPFIGAEIIFLYKLFNPKTKIVLQYHMDLIGKGLIKYIFYIYRILCLSNILKISNTILPSSIDYVSNSYIYSYYLKNKNKFSMLINGVDIKQFFPLSKIPEDYLGKYKNDDKKNVLFVAGLDKAHYFKGLENLLKSIENIEQVRLIIVGDGNLKNYYQDIVDNLQISNRVIFVGRVSDEELNIYYNICDFYAMPSTDSTEAYGLVFLEAMCAKKPVIASNLPGVRKVVQDNIDGLLVEPNNVQDLKEKINLFVNNPDKIRDMGEAGYAKINKYYLWNIITKRLVGIYNKHINNEV